jgi:hypothetical protein
MSTSLPPLEHQVAWLFTEMGTGNGGNIASTYNSNPNMSVSEATIAFENQFERSADTVGSSGMNARIGFANSVYNSYENGTLSSQPPNVQYVFNQALAQGYSPAQAAGIAGNLMRESGPNINPTAVNPNDAGPGRDSMGIAQWNRDRLANMIAYDPATGELVPNTEVQAGDVGLDGEPLTAEEAAEIREIADAVEAEAGAAGRRGESLYQENILNQFESYTYSWAMHMASPIDIEQGSALIDQNRVVTLAESGVENEVSIDRVDQDLVLTFAQENRNSVANQFNVEFIEPGGVTFFTRIYNAAQQLGIENHLQAVYILELNFRGWHDSGQAVPEIIGPYYYFCTMSTLTMDYKDGASFYSGKLVETHQDAYKRLEFHLTADMDFEASTFGEFLQEFETRINEQAQEQAKNGQGRILPNEYVLNTLPDASEWNSWQFDALSGDSAMSYSGISVSGSGTLRFSMAAGTAITSAMALAIFQTTNFKRLLTENGFAKDNPDDGEARPERLAELVRWVKFNTDVRYLDYDFIAKNYQKEITYSIGPYIAPEAIHDPNSYARLISSRAQQNDRLRNIFDNGLLRKRYDYTHTGLNTEILNLDIQLNNVYYTLQAINSGALNHREMLFNGSGAQQAQMEVAALRGDAQSLQDRMSSLRSDIDAAQNEIERINSEIRGPDDVIAARDNVQAQREIISSAQSEIRTLVPRIEQTTLEYETAYNAFLEQQRGGRTARTQLPGLQTRYITQGQLFSNPDIESVLPMTFRYGPVTSLATAGPDKGIDDIGSVMLGAVEMNLNSMADLVQQTMFVRGDPYWLGRPRDGSFANESQANYDVGGLQYFINMNFPTYPDENSGLQTNLSSFSITGLYRVYKVKASYADGAFTMMLTAFRDMNTNVEAVYEELLFGNVFDRAQESLEQRFTGQNETDDGGAPTEDTNGDGVIDSSDIINPAARGGDFGSVSGDTDGVDSRLLGALDTAAQQTGVTAVVSSGNRGPGGSGRHNGYAADTLLYSNGRLLSVENPADLAIIQNYTRSYLDATRAAGLTPSVGIANPAYGSGSSLYMSGTAFHYDIARTPGIGANLSPGAGPYWGGSQETAHHAPPSWLVNMYNS